MRKFIEHKLCDFAPWREENSDNVCKGLGVTTGHYFYAGRLAVRNTIKGAIK